MTTLEKRVWIATYAAAFVQYATVFPPIASGIALSDAALKASICADRAIEGLKLRAITSESLDVKPGAMR